MIFDWRLCGVSFLRFWFPDVEQPEIKNIAMKKEVTINLFIYLPYYI
ncbi:hypothetical protein SNSL317_A2103 [Salmonella enterica subsp. enterica serovar Newport str. SL317]|nr:hypothetical protein SNSL317_A2103 [Salmonella enterica subsp. enterica serovar Newport str. SL317]